MRDVVRALVAWALVATARAAQDATSSSPSLPQDLQKNSSKLVVQLRRQLMENNYDYIPSESEEPLVKKPVFKLNTLQDISTTAAPNLNFTYKTQFELNLNTAFNNPNQNIKFNNNTEGDTRHPFNDHNLTNNIDKWIDVFKKKNDKIDKKIKKFYTDYAEVKRENENLDNELKKTGFDPQIGRDYALLKNEHHKLNPTNNRHPSNREYDSPLLYEKSDTESLKPNQNHIDTRYLKESDSDINFLDENRKTKLGRIRYDRFDQKRKEKLKKHHNEYNNNARKENRHNDRNKHSNVKEDLQLFPRARDELKNIDLFDTSDKQIKIEKKIRTALQRVHVESNKSTLDMKHNVHKNDLLYYINDDRLRQAEENYLDLSNADDDISSSRDEATSTTTVKYNVFTVRSERDGRRLGAGGKPRTFLEEQRPGEVVLVRLDDAPFPQFRLPAARRQYMHSEEHHR